MSKSFNYQPFLKIYKEMNFFMKENGIEHKILKPGYTESNITILEKHLSSPNMAHGGVIASFLDSVMGFAALSVSIPDMKLVSTVEYKLNYFKPIYLKDVLVGKGTVLNKGNRIVVSKGEIYRNDELVAHAQGTFNAYPIEKVMPNLDKKNT